MERSPWHRPVSDRAEDYIAADAERAWAGSTSGWASSSPRSPRSGSSARCRSRGTPSPTACCTAGASVVLAETLGSIGSAMHAHPDRIAVGVDINATHHRAAHRRDRHRRRHPDPPGPHPGDLGDRGHRRAGQAGLHLTDHLRPGARRPVRLRRAARRPARRCERRAASTWVSCRPPTARCRAGRLRGELGADGMGGRDPEDRLRAESQPGHEPVALPGARRRRGGDVADAALLGEGRPAASIRCRPTPRRRKRGSTCGEMRLHRGVEVEQAQRSRCAGRSAPAGSPSCSATTIRSSADASTRARILARSACRCSGSARLSESAQSSARNATSSAVAGRTDTAERFTSTPPSPVLPSDRPTRQCRPRPGSVVRSCRD